MISNDDQSSTKPNVSSKNV
jgi:hypothetical protein